MYFGGAASSHEEGVGHEDERGEIQSGLFSRVPEVRGSGHRARHVLGRWR